MNWLIVVIGVGENKLMCLFLVCFYVILPLRSSHCSVIAAMVGGGARGRTEEDIQFTMKVLRDVKDIQWDHSDGYNRRVNLVKGTIVRRFYSEAWNGEAQEDAFLKSKGWNKIDSGFRLWSNEGNRRPDTDAFLDSKGWNDVDSSFRII